MSAVWLGHDRLGALGDLPERSLSAVTITQYLDGQPAITIRFGDLGLGEARPVADVAQADVEAELRRRPNELGVDVDWGITLVDVLPDDHGATDVLGDGCSVRCWCVQTHTWPSEAVPNHRVSADGSTTHYDAEQPDRDAAVSVLPSPLRLVRMFC